MSKKVPVVTVAGVEDAAALEGPPDEVTLAIAGAMREDCSPCLSDRARRPPPNDGC